MSQAKVDEWLHADRGSPWKHRDAGGALDPNAIGGIAPDAQTQNPLMQGMIQRYASMPTEKLTEMAAMMGGSQQGQVIQKVLQQRRLTPQAAQAPQQQQQTSPNLQPAAVPQKRGGATPKRAGGGPMGISPSEAVPWWTKAEARAGTDSGYLHGATAGRADSIQTTAPGGSYVIPADVIAGLGEGNNLAGARVMDSIIRTGPGGIPMPQMRHADTIPRPPPAYREPAMKSGGVKGGSGVTPVMLSHGEYVVAPHHVTRIGGGDLKRGHRILDHFVIEMRKRQIKELKNLKPPVGAKT